MEELKVDAEKWGINIRNRTMLYDPWPTDQENQYRPPTDKEKFETYSISGEAVRETLLYFEACGGDHEELVSLLNSHIRNSKFSIIYDNLLSSKRWYNNEYYFYFIMFTKELMGRYDFHFGENNREQLSEYHRIYEKGFIEYKPWGCTENDQIVGDITITNLTACFISLEQKMNNSNEMLHFINSSNPDSLYHVDRDFFNNETLFTTLEAALYGACYFEILINFSHVEDALRANLQKLWYVKFLFMTPRKIVHKRLTSLVNMKMNNVWKYDLEYRPGRLYFHVKQLNKTIIDQFSIYAADCVSKTIEANKGGWFAITNYISENSVLQKVIRYQNHIVDFDMEFRWPVIRTRFIRLSLLFGLIILVIHRFFLPLIGFSVLSFQSHFFLSIGTGSIIGWLVDSKNKLSQRFEVKQKLANEQLEHLEKASLELLKERNLLEQRVAERTEDLTNTNDRLKELDKSKTSLFTNVSHELRMPITNLKLALEMIMEGRNIDDLKADNPVFPRMYRQTNRLMNQINNLLNISRLELAGNSVEFQIANINELLLLLSAEVESSAVDRGIEIIFLDKTDMQQYAEVSVNYIESAVFNLIDNSLKHTPSGGQIILGLEQIQKGICISVKDTGNGIPETKLPYIFEKFYQVEDTLNRRYEGSGIGLSLVKEIAELHKGSIEVEYSSPEGTQINLILPVLDKERNVQDSVVTPPRIQSITSSLPIKSVQAVSKTENRKGRRILLVEDNLDFTETLKDILSDRYELLTALNGREALENLDKQSRPDLIISDIMMPEMDGVEFLKNIRLIEWAQSIPFIFLSARADTEERLFRLKEGAVDYLIKPFHLDELLSKIDTLINISDSIEQDLRTSLLEHLNNWEPVYNRSSRNPDSDNILMKNSAFTGIDSDILEQYDLTERQKEVLDFVVKGYTDLEIAGLLKLSAKTVSFHVGNILAKLKVSRRNQIAFELSGY
jgi:signal transduction histidine kinase/DNA-binding NarL/FixJ family response regulator